MVCGFNKSQALDVNQTKWRDILLCCTELAALRFVATKIAENETITYNTFKIEVKTSFFRDDYCRTLQHKFCELIFIKRSNAGWFLDEVTKAIKELFDIEDPETTSLTARNHAVTNLEKDKG